MPHSMWDLSSQTRDRTHIPCSGSVHRREVPVFFLKTSQGAEGRAHSQMAMSCVGFKSDP